MKHVTVQKNKVQKSTLYSVVFDAVAVRYVVTFLFIFFVLHPVMPALAAEDVSEESDTVEEVAPEPIPKEETIEDLTESVVEAQEEAQEIEKVEVVEEDSSEDSDKALVDDVLKTNEVVTTDEEVVEVTTNEEIVIEDAVLIQNEESEISEESILNESLSPLGEELKEFEEVSEVPVLDEESPAEESNIEESEITNETDLEELSMLLSGSGDENEEPTGEVAGASTTQESIADDTQSEEEGEDGVTSGGTDGSDDESISEDTNEIEETTKTDETEIDNESGGGSPMSEEVLEIDTTEIISPQDDVASTTPAVLSAEEKGDVVINNQNRQQFSDKECVAVGSGSFYCSESSTAPEYVEDRVFSAPDSDGDMEIFVTISGKTTQITHNLVDDVSPQYDGISDTIVWHSMQNDRFQIAQYNVSDGVINYLTNTSYNNTEPVAYGDIVMWQAWIDDNWEIMLYDNGEVTQLTDNEMHDITPQMRDGYIMWQTQFAEGWKVALYDQKTKKVSYIADSDGSGVANPRFVLVYDSTDKVGDVRTLGYDFGSGSSFTLGSLPAEIPEQIPEPDQTGETRALIQAKPTSREGEVDDIQPVSTGSGTSTDVTTGTTTESLSGDLVIAPLQVSASSTQDVVENVPADEEVVDQLISAELSTSGEDVSHIDEVVIPPFVSTTTQEMS